MPLMRQGDRFPCGYDVPGYSSLKKAGLLYRQWCISVVTDVGFMLAKKSVGWNFVIDTDAFGRIFLISTAAGGGWRHRDEQRVHASFVILVNRVALLLKA